MITYYKLTADLADRVKVYCESRGISFPVDAEVIFVAVSDSGEVVGVVGVKRIYQIEPLLFDIPTVGLVLGEKALGVLSFAGQNEAVAITKDSNGAWIDIMERYGFVVTDRNMTILKKEL